jgi:hypothetical protein
LVGVTWEVLYPVDGKWVFDSTHPDVESAVCAVVARAGVPVVAEWRDVSYALTSGGQTIACVREMIEQPTTPMGGKPEGRLGPLRRWRGLTWVGWLNYVVLRWFLFRLTYNVEEDGNISRYYFQFVPRWRWS